MKKILSLILSVALVLATGFGARIFTADAYGMGQRTGYRWRASAAASDTYQNQAAASASPAMIAAAKNTVPSVVAVYGVEESSPSKSISYSDLSPDDPIVLQLQALGIDGSGLQFEIPEEQQVTSGSGFIVSHDGYIVTNSHVVESSTAKYSVALFDGTDEPATVVYRNPESDIAVLKISGTYPSIASLGNSSDITVGETIASLGHAYGRSSNSVSIGTVSSLSRNISAESDTSVEHLTGVIETSASIVPGYSGGPVIDSSGNVLAMNVATGEYSSYMIPINLVKNTISSYIQ